MVCATTFSVKTAYQPLGERLVRGLKSVGHQIGPVRQNAPASLPRKQPDGSAAPSPFAYLWVILRSHLRGDDLTGCLVRLRHGADGGRRPGVHGRYPVSRPLTVSQASANPYAESDIGVCM